MFLMPDDSEKPPGLLLSPEGQGPGWATCTHSQPDHHIQNPHRFPSLSLLFAEPIQKTNKTTEPETKHQPQISCPLQNLARQVVFS